MSLEKELLKHKLQIKEWEKSFATNNGRVPSKADVKANQEIFRAYKTYNQLKSKQKKRQQREEEALKQKAQKPGEKSQKPEEKSLDALDFVPSIGGDEESDHEGNAVSNAELGPTPQANGKVLSLFDFLSPPESSPLRKQNESSKPINSSPLKDTALFRTPTKSVKRIELSDLTPSANSSAKKSLTSALKSVSTPSKQSSTVNDIETPFYLGKVNSRFQFSLEEGGSPSKKSTLLPVRQTIDNPKTPTKRFEEPRFSTSPSPFKTERMSSFGNNTKLTDVFNEAINLQIDEQLKLEVESELMLEMEQDTDEEETPQAEPTNRKTRKRITQKRTTRRWKIKPRGEDDISDTFEGKNVHEEIKRIEEKEKKELLEYMEGPAENAEPSDDEEEEEFVKPTPTEPAKKRKRLTPISNNFKRLKINDPRTKRFKQRMKRR